VERRRGGDGGEVERGGERVERPEVAPAVGVGGGGRVDVHDAATTTFPDVRSRSG
jgi:hypothetical protein